jgi:hypothetical protein
MSRGVRSWRSRSPAARASAGDRCARGRATGCGAQAAQGGEGPVPRRGRTQQTLHEPAAPHHCSGGGLEMCESSPHRSLIADDGQRGDAPAARMACGDGAWRESLGESHIMRQYRRRRSEHDARIVYRHPRRTCGQPLAQRLTLPRCIVQPRRVEDLGQEEQRVCRAPSPSVRA